MPDETPAVSSPAPAEPAAPPAMETWSTEQHSKWRLTGETPPAPPAEQKGEEPPAVKEDSTPSEEKPTEADEKKAETASDSGTDKSQEKPKQEHPPKGANFRIQQLLREKKQLEEKLARYEQPQQPAVKAEPAPAAAAADGEPIPPDTANWTGTWQELDAANRKYFKDLGRWEAKQVLAEELAERDRQAAVRAAEEREAGAKAKWQTDAGAEIDRNPEFAEVLDVVGKITSAAKVSDLIIGSDHGVELVKWLWANDKEALRILQLGDRVAIAREFGRIEARLQNGNGKPPEPKKISSASKPGTELSATNGAVPDEAQEALKQGDYPRYARIMNARETQKFHAEHMERR